MPLWQVRNKVGIPGSEIGSGKHKEPEGNIFPPWERKGTHKAEGGV
jgi:hypothetical protein